MVKLDIEMPFNCSDCELRDSVICAEIAVIGDDRPEGCPLYEDRTEGSTKLGMSLDMMEEEIELMRDFDKYCQINVPGYDMITSQFALDRSCSWLTKNGVDSTDFRTRLDKYKGKKH